MLDTLHGLLTDIREPLLFVVVGEVKAGKSSFSMRFSGRSLPGWMCSRRPIAFTFFATAPEEKSVEVSPQLTERYLPIPFLRDFNVVDTPGTNTMVAEHQTITENFVPRADLVLFVFSVTNPWSQSAWDLLNLVQKKWLKNIVFVLQQADLREPAEIEIIRRHLAGHGHAKTRIRSADFRRFRAQSSPGPHHRSRQGTALEGKRVRPAGRTDQATWSLNRARGC